MQDDRHIVKIAALNDKYKLVERPRFLSSFDTITWENKFATSVFRKHFRTEICTFITKGIFDTLLAEATVYSFYLTENVFGYYFLVGILMGLLISAAIAVLFCRQRKKPRCIPIQLIAFVFSFSTMLLIGPMVQSLIFREALEVTFAVYMMLAFLTRSF